MKTQEQQTHNIQSQEQKNRNPKYFGHVRGFKGILVTLKVSWAFWRF